MTRKVEVSHKTIIFTVLFLLFLWFIFFIKDIILMFFIALLVMTILDPLVTKLSKYKVPRGLSVLVSYAVVLGTLGFTVAAIIPPLVSETTAFATGLPEYLENLGIYGVVGEQAASQLVGLVGSLPGQVVKIGLSIFSNFFATVTVLVFAFYLLLSREKLDEQLGIFFGEVRKKDLGKLIDTLEFRLGGWARGQLTLMVIIGIVIYTGLRILGIPYALPLAMLAGLLEMIPYLGPIVAAVPSIIIGFGISPVMGIGAAALALIVQQLENYLLVPKIMEKSVGVSPIITLLALAIGGRLAGVVGIIISVPVVITLQVVVSRYLAVEK